MVTLRRRPFAFMSGKEITLIFPSLRFIKSLQLYGDLQRESTWLAGISQYKARQAASSEGASEIRPLRSRFKPPRRLRCWQLFELVEHRNETPDVGSQRPSETQQVCPFRFRFSSNLMIAWPDLIDCRHFSRSHAVFTIHFAAAQISGHLPRETSAKVHLVDLAGRSVTITTAA